LGEHCVEASGQIAKGSTVNSVQIQEEKFKRMRERKEMRNCIFPLTNVNLFSRSVVRFLYTFSSQ
jgi:hypothetical protein